MAIFVNYGGPRLDKEQKQVIRSQVMIVVRGRQKQVKRCKKTQPLSPHSHASAGRLAPAPVASTSSSGSGSNTDPSSSEDDDTLPQAATQQSLIPRPRPAHRKRNQLLPTRHQHQHQNQHQNQQPLNPYDLPVPPPRSTHSTGVDARTMADYLARCGSYSSYLDEAFVLVGFRQPSYFRPDLSKAACIYIGWLLTAGMLDARRGVREEGKGYPYYEYHAVRELQRFVDGAGQRELHEVVYPVIILGMFEMFRFSPRAIAHLAAVERFIKSRGGLHTMPDVMQHLVIMTDTLQCVCLNTPLAFNVLGPAPVPRLLTADGFLAGDQVWSCPLLLCDDENLSLAGQYVDAAIRGPLVAVLQAARDSFQHFFFPSPGETDDAGATLAGLAAVDVVVDAVLAASSPPAAAANDVPARLLETCALAARIMHRTLAGDVDGFDDAANEADARVVYENTRFVGLKAWRGLPYIYVWVNLIGFAASTSAQMRGFFVAEVVRCAFSYGCYQMEVFQGVLMNFLHLRNAIAGCKLALETYVMGKDSTLF
ncbi:hypothetical protein C8A05DRAFT_17396 [Staphylotrichum tortipilum]|uniref:Uncharacterized protein n=1 Tax=Staphylotrichum tortipilum TaxID=2831512 RepID=A0AAN6MHJ8_9PEZI|nr:hypothetical protein C8A05DRAFT_17396 [Staphylotrichum longicolle]